MFKHKFNIFSEHRTKRFGPLLNLEVKQDLANGRLPKLPEERNKLSQRACSAQNNQTFPLTRSFQGTFK